MSDSRESLLWLSYAAENLALAQVSLDHDWHNACLQNSQQAIEKALKAMLAERGLPIRRTHSTRDLSVQLRQAQVEPEISGDESELIDSIYMPSKYPPDSALPFSMPDRAVCSTCLQIASRAVAAAQRLCQVNRP